MYPDLQWFDAYQNPEANVRPEKRSFINTHVILIILTWISVTKTCKKKMDALIWEKHQVVELRPSTPNRTYQAGCEKLHKPKFQDPRKNDSNETETTRILCKQTRSFRSARERWWFIAIANCNSKKVSDVLNKFKFSSYIKCM